MRQLLVCLCVLFSLAAFPQEKRLALVIGIGEYVNAPTLPNPGNDAKAIARTLKKMDFDVIQQVNLDQRSMKMAIDDFGMQLKEYDVGLFFFAGHGLQVDGINYLVPSDANLNEARDAEYNCVRADRVLGKMESSNSKTNIVILDACRDNPFERSWSRGVKGKGLAFMNAPAGSLIAYATSPGNTASDGTGDNGLYTSALLQHIGTPNVSIEDIFKRVRVTVEEESNGRQTPWEATSLMGSFYFRFDERLPVITEEEIPSQWVVITSEPSGGDLYINGQHVGQTPFQQEMKEGEYSYTIRKDLYHEASDAFTLLAEEGRKKIEVNLKPRFGRLSIKSYPENGASITLNGQPTGETTPYTREQLTSGNYTVTLRKDWYETKTEEFTMADGEDKVLNVNMKPLFGEISISGDPGSEIWVDGELMGTGTFNGRLNAGLHTFEMRRDNFHPDLAKTEIKAGEKQEISLKLKPMEGTLKIVATPVETNIRLNGENYGTTPQTIRKIAAGSYQLELSKEGYASVVKQIEIMDSETTEINEQLDAEGTTAVTTPPPKEKKEKTRSREYTGDVSTAKVLLQSAVLPGWGLTTLSEGKPWWIAGVTAYACVGSAVIFNQLGMESYNSYLEPSGVDQANSDYQTALTQQWISRSSAIAAAAIWVGSMTYSSIRLAKAKKEPTVQKHGSTLQLGLKPDVVTGTALVTINLVF